MKFSQQKKTALIATKVTFDQFCQFVEYAPPISALLQG
jgi:hypothetical protein